MTNSRVRVRGGLSGLEADMAGATVYGGVGDIETIGGLTGANPDFSADMGLAGESVERLAAVEPSIAAFGHGGAPVTDDVAAKLAALSGA